MGWATSVESQQAVIQSLKRAGINVLVFEVNSKQQLVDILQSLNAHDCLVWPNAYQVHAVENKKETVWLADIIDEQGFSIIGSNADALRSVLLKDQCQRILEHHHVAIPHFASIEQVMLNDLEYVLEMRNLTFPLFTKPNALSTSKGITQQCVVHNIDELRNQISLLGKQYGYPVMVEEYLPGQDITVAVFMTPERPLILATYYDTDIYDNPGAVLDYDIRQLDWDDRKGLRIVTEPEILTQIEGVVLEACKALKINEFTRIDCRLDRNGILKAFDVNGLPGLELPFSTTVWQMIVRMPDQTQEFAFDSLISLIVYCATHRHHMSAPKRIEEYAARYISQFSIDTKSTESV